MSTATILRRVKNAAAYLVNGQVMPAEPAKQPRVGMLTSGELIVLPANGGTLILSPETTLLVRDVLDADAQALRVFPVGMGGTTP